MNAPYTEEHELFRNQVRQFCEKELAPHADAGGTSEVMKYMIAKISGW